MAEQTPKRFKNRRKGPDIWVQSLALFGSIGWFLMFIGIVIIAEAKPQIQTFFDRISSVPLRADWDLRLLRLFLLVMIIGFFISFLGLVINSHRHRRKDDTYRRYLIFLGIISVLGIIRCLFLF
jgi:hypothetical protein